MAQFQIEQTKTTYHNKAFSTKTHTYSSSKNTHRLVTYLESTQGLFQGKAPSRYFLVYQVLYMLIFAIIILRSIRVYSTTYNILYDYISNLGVYYHNSAGYRLFNFSLIFFGLAGLPIYSYAFGSPLNLNNSSLEKVINYLSTAFSIINCIGMAMVGMFPAIIRVPHLISAGMVFIGLFLANNLHYFVKYQQMKILLAKEPRNKANSSHKHRLSKGMAPYRWILAVYNTIAVLFVISLLFEGNIIPESVLRPKIFSCSLWEWTYFLSCVGMLIFWFFDRYTTEQSQQASHLVQISKNSQDEEKGSEYAMRTKSESTKDMSKKHPFTQHHSRRHHILHHTDNSGLLSA